LLDVPVTAPWKIRTDFIRSEALILEGRSRLKDSGASRGLREQRNFFKRKPPEEGGRLTVSQRARRLDLAMLSLPTAVEVMSVAPAPSGTPNRSGVRIRLRCRIDWIFFNHHRRWRDNDRPLNNDGRSHLIDNYGGRSGLIRVSVSFPLVAWPLAVIRRYR
jgi:hypothetical protein